MPIGGEKIVPLDEQVAALRENGAALAKGVATLRRLLRAMRWDDQGGYSSRQNGKWLFISTGLPQTTPEDLDELFALAGIEPDEVVPKGNCFHCKHAREDGRERGYDQPCCTCTRPYHSNFVPANRVTMMARFKRPLDQLRQSAREKTIARLIDPSSDGA